MTPTNTEPRTADRMTFRQVAEDSVAAMFEPLSGRSRPEKSIVAACKDSALASIRLFFWPLVVLSRVLGWTGGVLIAVSVLLFAWAVSVVLPDHAALPELPPIFMGVYILWLLCFLTVLYATKKSGSSVPSWLAGGAVLAGTALVIVTFLAVRTAPGPNPDQASLEERLGKLATSLDNANQALNGARARLEAAETGLSQARSDLKALQKDLEETKKSIPDKDAITAAARAEARDSAAKAAEAVLASLSNKLDGVSQALKDEAVARKKDVADSNATISDLNTQLKKVDAAASATAQNLTDLKADVRKLAAHSPVDRAQRLTGTWRLVEVKPPDGDPHFDPRLADAVFTFDVDRLTIRTHDKEGPDATLVLPFAADPDEVPSRINLHFRREQGDKPFDPKRLEDVLKYWPYLKPFTRPDVLGIYKVTDESLLLCVGDFGESVARPKELKAGGDSKAFLLTLHRAGKD